MADNVAITPGAGAPIATDDIGGAHYQRGKLIHGVDGVSDGDVAKTNPFPIRAGVSLTRDFSVAQINASASGANAVITPVAGKTVRVHGWAFKVGGAVSVYMNDTISGALTPSMPFANNGDGWVMDMIGQPYLVTGVGGNVAFVLSAAVPVTGLIFYSQD